MEQPCSSHPPRASGFRRVGNEGGGCTLADELVDSSHTSGAASPRHRADGAADFPGAAFWCHCHSIGEAFAADRDDNCECWRHTPRADSHWLLGVAREGSASDQRDTAASHQAGGQSLVPRSDPLSRASPPEEEHILRAEPCAMKEGELEKIRLCGSDQDEADAPVPGGGSRSTGPPPASTPVPRPSGCTIDLGRSLGLHPRALARMAPRCRYNSTTSQAVKACCGRFVKNSS